MRNVCLKSFTFVIPANSRGGEKSGEKLEDEWMLRIGLAEENWEARDSNSINTNNTHK